MRHLLTYSGFSFTGTLRKHKMTHITTKNEVCPDCGAAFKLKSYLYIHMKNCQRSVENTCLKCGKTFRNPGNLKNHVASGDCFPGNKCRFCDESFPSRQTLKKHMRKEHREYKNEFYKVARELKRGKVKDKQSRVVTEDMDHSDSGGTEEYIPDRMDETENDIEETEEINDEQTLTENMMEDRTVTSEHDSEIEESGPKTAAADSNQIVMEKTTDDATLTNEQDIVEMEEDESAAAEEEGDTFYSNLLESNTDKGD